MKLKILTFIIGGLIGGSGMIISHGNIKSFTVTLPICFIVGIIIGLLTRKDRT